MVHSIEDVYLELIIKINYFLFLQTVSLTEKHLVSICSEFNHVRTWSVTRFRGMISTQPGSTPLASFKIVTIDALDSPISYSSGNDIGKFLF